MSRLIDAENVKPHPKYTDAMNAAIIAHVLRQETVDAVPVTRCVECNYSSMEGWYCNGCGIMPAHPTFPNEYCSKGRMTNNGLL